MVVKGIDISSQTSKVDIEKLKKEKIEFVMIRAGFTDYNNEKTKNVDKKFYENYDLFRKNNFKIGTYYTFLATTLQDAKKELDYFLDIIKDNVFEYPVAIQIEDDHNTIIYYPESQKTINKELLVNIVDYIYKTLNNYDYISLIRTYENWYYNIFEENSKYNYWLDNIEKDNNGYLFYTKEDDIINFNKDKGKDKVEIILKEDCFFKIVGNYIKAGYKILKSKIRKK